jgi:GNAT superfamily N-acetyltransferase
MIRIIKTTMPDKEEKGTIFRLWNTEYPVQLGLESLQQLDQYLENLINPTHFFAINEQNAIVAWAFTFFRDDLRWFAVIVDSAAQKSGIGTIMLNKIKEEEKILHGWVTDHFRYVRSDGLPYPSPLAFYIRNGFEVNEQERLETGQLSAVRIRWETAKC